MIPDSEDPEYVHREESDSDDENEGIGNDHRSYNVQNNSNDRRGNSSNDTSDSDDDDCGVVNCKNPLTPFTLTVHSS